MLTHNDASALLSSAAKALESAGKAAAIAVTDSHGELLSFLRLDGCPLPSINNAINKAYTSARERAESGAVGSASRSEGFPMTNFGDLRYTGWGGGVPIIVDGNVVGAIGISGLPEADDVSFARAAVAQFVAGS